jgi:hypothetical protein
MNKERKTNATTGAEEPTSSANRDKERTSGTEHDLKPLQYGMDEVSRLTGLKKTSLYKARKSGALKTGKFGRRTVVTHENVLRFIRVCQDPGAAEGKSFDSPVHPGIENKREEDPAVKNRRTD